MGVNPLPCLLLSLALTVLAASIPAAATLVLSRATLTPQNLPLTPLQELKLDAMVSIIPSGARTFPAGHTLQLETDLSSARWNAGVVVDGIPAAQQGGEGEVIFVSGYVLSYSTSRDVAVEVTVDGTVPAEAASGVTVLKIQELDNGGIPVPGSSITVVEPVATPAAPSPSEPVPVAAISPGKVPVSPSPTKASGFLSPPAMVAAGAGWAAYYRRHQKKRTGPGT